VRKTTRYGSYLIAEPEKAILDWIYMGIQNGTAPALDELDFGSVDRPKLLNYARKFPSSIYLHVLPALVETAVQKETNLAQGLKDQALPSRFQTPLYRRS
jgi:hypothetical protein